MFYEFRCCAGNKVLQCSISVGPPPPPECDECGEPMKRVYSTARAITDPFHLREGNRPVGSATDRLAQMRADEKRYEKTLVKSAPSKQTVSMAELAQKAGFTT